MAYIGNVPAEKYTALTQQTFSTPTGTSFTLSQAVTNSVDIDLYIDNVKQDPTTYSVSGTALTTSTIASPSTMYCIFNGRTTETVNPPDGSVGTAKVTDDAITLAKLAPGTDGNIISYDASGNPVAIATGSSGEYLKSNGAGAAPSFSAIAASGLSSQVVEGVYNLATASGTVDYTGAGFTPTAVVCFGMVEATQYFSIGMADSDGLAHSLTDYHTVTADSWANNGANLIGVYNTGSHYVLGTVAYISDGIRVTYVKGGSPSGSFRIKFLLLK